MFLKIVFWQFVTYFLLRFAVSEIHNDRKELCRYDHTVDLTGVPQNANGSYLYGDIEIPREFVDIYDYQILDNGTKINVNQHQRGCICLVRRCLRVCSKTLAEYYYGFEDRSDVDFSFIKNLTLNNGTTKELHLIHDFHHVVGVTCEHPFLLPELYPFNEWTLYENGTLHRHADNYYLSDEPYCFDLYEFGDDDDENVRYFVINPRYCNNSNLPWNFFLNAYAMVISIPFFVITIAVYYWMRHLKKVHARCFITYLSWLTLSYSLISFLIISRIEFSPILCRIYGYAIYFTITSYLTWICIISYDTWKTMTSLTENSSFARYCIVGWSVPALMTLLTYAAQITIPYEDLTPGIDESNCGINTDRWSACIYFYIPAILVLIYGLTLYIKIIIYCTRNKNLVKVYSCDLQKSKKKKLYQYFRLFVIMGVSWFFEILSYFLKMTLWTEKVIFAVPDFITASQGFFIFLIFICRKSVWNKIRERRIGHEMLTIATPVHSHLDD